MNREHAKTSGTRGYILALLFIVAGAALPQQSSAIPFLAWYAQDVAIRNGSVPPATLTPAQELALTIANNAAYLSEAAFKPIGFVGLTAIDGSTSPFELTGNGQILTLSFEFINPATGVPTTGPAVSSVLYEANLDPSTPNVLVPIGTSSAFVSNFAITWQSSGFEPMIEAIPYDANGNPIVISGVDGENSAVGLNVALNAPDSSPTSVLLGLGIVGLFCVRRWSQVATLRGC